MSGIDGVRGLFRGLAISASGLSAQRKRMDVIATNIANAQTTSTAEGGPYRRRVLDLEQAQTLDRLHFTTPLSEGGGIPFPMVPEVPEVGTFPAAVMDAYGVEVGQLREDFTEGNMVYEPGHPDADENGYVLYPNVNLTTEMIDLMESTRAYEANATVFDAMKSMLRRAIQI